MKQEQIVQRMRDNLTRAGTGLGVDQARLWQDGDAILVEVLKLWPAPDEAFIRGLVPLLLGREADAAGMAYGLSLLQSHSRLQAIRTLAECEEAQARRLDTSWLPKLEQLHPDGRGVRLQVACRRALRALLRIPSKLGAAVLRRMWEWSGNPLRAPMEELVALARQTAALPPVQQPSMPVSNRPTPVESIQDQRWFEVANQLHQLRRTCASLLTTATPTAPDAPPVLKLTAASGCACRVCGGPLAFKWRARVVNDRHEAEYYECVRCFALQIPNPSWLEEAYREEDRPLFWNPDTGRFRRNFSAYCFLRALGDSGVLPDQPRLLDYGGGYGLLTQMLRDGGLDGWLADPYIPRPFFCPDRHIADLRDLPAGSFDTATAFEVYEHLTEPSRVGSELRRILRPNGVFLLSTGIYHPGVHGPDWPYLCIETGQHVTFWSRRALSHHAACLGFRSVGYSPSTEGFTILFTALAAEDLKPRLTRAAQLLQQPDYLGKATRSWEFTHAQIFTFAPEPLVEPARLCDAEVACAS